MSVGDGQDAQDFGFGASREPKQWWPFWETTRFRMARHEYYCIPFHREVRRSLVANTAVAQALDAKLTPLCATVNELAAALAPLREMTPELTTVRQVVHTAKDIRQKFVRRFLWFMGAIGMLSGILTAWPYLKWAVVGLFRALAAHLNT